MNGLAPTCPSGCGRAVRPGHLLCAACWKEVPQHIQREVNRCWRRFTKTGEDDDWQAYKDVRERAIGAVK